MYTVFMADDDKDWLNVLEMGINLLPDFNVIATTYNGNTALDLIKQLHPDVIILDIVMPGLDSAYIVEQIKYHMNGYDPVIYIISGIATNTIVKMLSELDVDFYSMKSVSIDVVTGNLQKIVPKKRLNDTHQINPALDQQNEATAISLFIKRLGVPPQLLSTQCVALAISLCLQKPEYMRMLTKALYPDIAKEMSISTASVEKNIRDTIARAQKNTQELFVNLFETSANKKITNGEFLAISVEHLKLLMSD